MRKRGEEHASMVGGHGGPCRRRRSHGEQPAALLRGLCGGHVAGGLSRENEGRARVSGVVEQRGAGGEQGSSARGRRARMRYARVRVSKHAHARDGERCGQLERERDGERERERETKRERERERKTAKGEGQGGRACERANRDIGIEHQLRLRYAAVRASVPRNCTPNRSSECWRVD